MCPPHFNCSATNHTFLEDADLIPGYWRSGPQSVKAIACHGIDRCLGLGPGDAACTPGSNLSGLRCDVCPSGQYFVDRTLTCTECTPHQIRLSILFLALLFALSAIAPIVFITCWERLRCRGYTASKTNDAQVKAFRDQAQLDLVRKTLSGPPSQPGHEELSHRSELSRRSEFSKMLSVYDLRSGSEEKSMSAGDKLRACARIAIGLLRGLTRYMRGHFYRRLRAVLRHIDVAVKLRMTFAHLQFVSMLPNTFQLNSFHNVPEVSRIFPSERSGNWLLDAWAFLPGKMACLFSVKQGKYRLTVFAFEIYAPLLLCVLLYLVSLAYGACCDGRSQDRSQELADRSQKLAPGDTAPRRRIHFARIRWFSRCFPRAQTADAGLTMRKVVELAKEAKAKEAFAANSNEGGSAAVAAAKPKVKARINVAKAWERTWKTWRDRGVPLPLPYNHQSTLALHFIIFLLWVLAPFLSQRAFDILFCECLPADNKFYVESWPSAHCEPDTNGSWRPVDANGHKLVLLARFQAILYAGVVPIFFFVLLFANDHHIREGSKTNNARAIRWLTRGYKNEREQENEAERKQRLMQDSLRRSDAILHNLERTLIEPVRARLAELLARLRLNWEIAEYLKLVTITSFSCSISRGTSFQALVSLLLILGHLAIFLFVKPLRTTSNRTFLAFCHLVQAWAVIVCLLLHLQAAADDTPLDQPYSGLEELENGASDPVLRMLSSAKGHQVLQKTFDSSLLINLCLLACTALYGYLFDEQPVRTLRWVDNDRPIQRNDLPMIKYRTGERWHLFLSHTWYDGQNQTHSLYDHLRDMIPGLKCFLDIHSLESLEHLEDYVHQSKVFLLFLSPAYLEKENCLREFVCAVELEKPIVVVVDIETNKQLSLNNLLVETRLENWKTFLGDLRLPSFEGKTRREKEALIQKCAERLCKILKGEEDDPEEGPIPYENSNAIFRQVTLRLIGQQVFRRLRGSVFFHEKAPLVALPHEFDAQEIPPPKKFDGTPQSLKLPRAHVYISQHNKQAVEVIKKLSEPQTLSKRDDLVRLSAAETAGGAGSCLHVQHVDNRSRTASVAASLANKNSADEDQLTLRWTHKHDADFANVDTFFVYLTKEMVEGAKKDVADIRTKKSPARELYDLLHEVDEFIQKRRTTWQNTDDLVCFYEADPSSALVHRGGEAPGGSTFGQILNEWKEFEEQLSSHYGKHHDDGVNGGLIRWLNKSRAEVGSVPENLKKKTFQKLFTDPRHPHHRITTKLLASALCSPRSDTDERWCGCCLRGPTHDELHSDLQAQARERSRQQRRVGAAADGDVELTVLPDGLYLSEVAEDRDGPESSSGADHGRRPARLTAQATTPDLLSSFGG